MSKSDIPLRSPTPPLDSSSDELNELSLEQELAHLDRPHFLDYTQIGIPSSGNDHQQQPQPPPIPPRNPLTNSLPLNRRSSIPVKMIRSADNVPSYDTNAAPCGKKHFLDENPIPPDYDYNRPHRSLDRAYGNKAEQQDENAIKMQFDVRRHSGDRQKQKKIKEPSYTLSRFLENDEALNQYNDNEVHLSDVNLCTTTTDRNSFSNPRTDYVYSILSMIGCNNQVDVSKKFLDLSRSSNTCGTLRQSRCIPLLVQMIHCGPDDLTRQQAREALRNVVNYHPDDKAGRREVKVLRYIEQIMDYCDLLRKFKENESDGSAALDSDSHPLQAMSSLMKVSFDEEHRHSMCTLGALQTIADLVHIDHAVHGTNPNDPKCISLRRYAGMALTNLTFGDGNNKALLCANRDFMKALVAQIHTDADDLLQVTANVLRNLSWRADDKMKTVLNQIGTVTALTKAAMRNKNETTLRAILSALWNLSAHCSKNKAEFCMVEGALLFMVEMLTYESPSKTLSIVENAGGILRNVSSHIAVNEDFRKILRQRNCLGILLQQLRSESLTIVSNACGTLWNLSARSPEDQKFLWDNGAVPMLRSLINSKHKMISNGSKIALKNLVNFRPGEMSRGGLDPVAKSMGLKELPTLSARKQRALEDELDENLSETCENIETTKTPPPLVNQKAPKSFTVLERDQHFMERSFGHISLECNGRENIERTKPAADFWEPKPFEGNPSADFSLNEPPAQHPTGTIPKRAMQVDETTTGATVPNDSDQITNFSLVYSENHPEIRDAKAQKSRTFSVADEDTLKCYDNEGTPLLSTATSISDLRPLPKHPVAHNMHRHSKSGRTTTENSGINTPEKPMTYCEEGTPAYFSRRDSFSSLHEEAEFIQDNIQLTHKPNQLNLMPAHKNNGIELNALAQPNDQIHNVDRSQQEYENNSNNNTVPTTPGECPSKTVTFNEFNLETPMMFSRHSSLGSLASHEPALIDDTISVVSETSRMPSGTISPSEIPDSPSQTMPQSPRQKHSSHNSREGAPNPRRLPFEDEVRTFGVENTPALISCATSLSNLSLDDEPKIANDLLIKEMRLMHHLSDEQDDEQLASTSADQNDANPNFALNEPENCDAGEALSDSDDSSNDDDTLLKDCISAGMRRKNIESDIKSPPALPEPNDILPEDSSSDDDDPTDLLAQCIRTGITKQSNKPPTECSANKLIEAKLPSQQMIKENPIGMLRKGGNSFIETNYDEMNRFHIEDSPCNFSIASGLSDLTVGSHPIGLLKVNRLPSIQSDANEENEENLNENRSLSPLSMNSEEDRQLLNQAFVAGIRSTKMSSQKASDVTSSQSSSALTARNVEVFKNQDQKSVQGQGHGHAYDDSNNSVSSMDSNDSNELLQQCIQVGMGKLNKNAPTKPQAPVKNEDFDNCSMSSMDSNDSNTLLQQCIQVGMGKMNHTNTITKLPTKVALVSVQGKKSQLPTPKASTSQPASNHRSRSTKRESDDKQLLMECINAGIERSIRSKSTVIEKSSCANALSKCIDAEQFRNMPSKNVQTTSATVSHTVGATDVVKDKRKGTACAHDPYQMDAKSAQTMISKKEHDHHIIRITDDTIEITAPAAVGAASQTETGYNNSALSTSMMSTKSHNSFNMGCDHNMSLLERSNEYPSHLGQNESIYDSQHSSSVDMEVSNECLFENLSPPKMDKHKDPNLMLQSVERLTQELVSTAEYLRTANSFEDDITITESKQTFSISNDTWNEDTHPNGASFPKMSKEAPIIASMNDDDTTISELNGSREMAKSEFIENSTSINNNNNFIDFDRKSESHGLRFEIGGKVNQLNSGTNSCNGFDSHTTTSTMTNSTIIAIEANKIRSQLMKDNKTDSMISLDKIRPPSVMEKMNNSSYCDSFTGASSLNRSPARFLTQGFMARRALHNNGNNSTLGSTDSINSSCNLDKVKPPSIMDDLLDSMISVDSIGSELVENTLQQPIEEQSHYETAFSECDDMTQTLKNCVDLPFDNNSTPCGSDFSSAESTPRKGRRSLTPRRKRQLTKDRYQTYTISTDGADGLQCVENGINSNEPPAENQSLFHMQLSNHPLLINGSDSDAISLVSSDGEMSSIRAFTKNLPYLNDICIHNEDHSYHNEDYSINTNTYTKLPRGSIQNSLQSTPMPSGNFYESLPFENGSSNPSSKTASPNRTITKSPRIVRPKPNAIIPFETPSPSDEPKAIRGRKKPTYVSPYSMTKLNKSSPPAAKPPTKVVMPKIEPPKSSSLSKTVESRAKSFIQRSAESLKKMRPSFTSKLTRQNSKKSSEEKTALDRQISNESTNSSETLVRQGTFIKDEPSEGEIPVIVSEPSSPRKSKTLVSKIPFNRTTSLQSGRNVTKSNTNIEIPSQKNASTTFIRRSMKSASSTSQISLPSSRGSLSPRQSLDSPSTSRSIFNRWTPPHKKVSPLPPTSATRITATKTTSRESIGTAAAQKPVSKVGVKFMANTPGKLSKIGTCRTISTNGRTTKV